MKAAHRRLDKVEASLTPKQQVLRWLDHALGFSSTDDYVKWLRNRPVAELPRVRIPEVVADGIRRSLRGNPKEVTERAVQNAVRDVLFLTKLVLDLNALVEDTCGIFALRAALCARGLQLLLVQGAVGQRGKGTTPLAGMAAGMQEIGGQVHSLLAEVYEVQYAVALISRRYFDGHAILFPQRAGRLARVSRVAETVASEFNALAAPSPDRSRDSERPSAEAMGRSRQGKVVDLSVVREAARLSALSTARHQVNLARADALWDIGRAEEAVERVKALVVETREGLDR